MGTRIKTFDATGVAPNGRLFAGDLNSIQDQYADLANFSQTVDLGTLRVGDSSLQLVKYGSGELRFTSALRTDGIVRALGGLYGGAFTTTQRDAIASGSRPYGLIILNTTTNQYEWNQGSDATPSWVAVASGTKIGTLSSRPAASIANAGSGYFATDDKGGRMAVSNGSAWVNVGLPFYAEFPIGAVCDWPWAAGSIPAQALLPYGQAVSRSTYAELNTLAAATSYAHGAGDGTTTFNLPDYRGRTGAGLDDMGGSAANRITNAVSGIVGTTLGAAGGVQGVTLTVAQIPSHTHEAKYGLASGPPCSAWGPNGGCWIADSTYPTGGGGSHTNVQPAIMVNKLMRAL